MPEAVTLDIRGEEHLDFGDDVFVYVLSGYYVGNCLDGSDQESSRSILRSIIRILIGSAS